MRALVAMPPLERDVVLAIVRLRRDEAADAPLHVVTERRRQAEAAINRLAKSSPAEIVRDAVAAGEGLAEARR